MSHVTTRVCAALAASLALGAVTLAAAPLTGGRHVLANARITMVLADPATGLTTANANRVDSLTWVDSAGVTSGNLASSGGQVVCNDPYETFGQARGDFSEEPRFIVAGTHANWHGTTAKGRTATTHLHCKGLVLAGTVKSTYAVVAAPAKINLVEITRAFSFNGSGSGVNADLRAFMPRLPDSTYDVVLVPDSTGAIQTYSALACDSICQVTNWNGKWLADDDGNGNGMMVIRAPAATLPAAVDVDHDGSSDSDDSTIALLPPPGGWSGTVSETEYLCFYDATSWPAAKRAAGKLPSGCAVKGL